MGMVIMYDDRAKIVEIQVTDDGIGGTKVWVNVDGKCELRVYEAKEVVIDDQRIKQIS
jgi:hypothetical protein